MPQKLTKLKKKPKSFLPVDDTLQKQGHRPAREILKSPQTNKSIPKIK